MKLTTIATIFSALCAGALATPSPNPDYEATTDASWELEVFPDQTIQVNGTIEEARAQALRLNPKWDEEYLAPAQEEFKRAYEAGEYDDDDYYDEYEEIPEDEGTSPAGSVLEKRAKKFAAKRITCGGRWKDVDYTVAMRNAAKMMSGQSGKKPPSMGAGPGECARVSCSYGTAIVWCNDNKKPITLPGWQSIYQGASAVLVKCRHDVYGHGYWAAGQAFHKDNWNVIVRKESC